MKRVKMLRTIAFTDQTYVGDVTYPLPDDVADHLIKDGSADLIEVVLDAKPVVIEKAKQSEPKVEDDDDHEEVDEDDPDKPGSKRKVRRAKIKKK